MSLTPQKTYRAIAHTLQALENCQKVGNKEWLERHDDRLDAIMESAPSGSGFDAGTSLDKDASSGDKLIFNLSFHHMNDGGYYDGWTDHIVRVKPSLLFGFEVTVSGRDKNQVKDYIAETFEDWLSSDDPTFKAAD